MWAHLLVVLLACGLIPADAMSPEVITCDEANVRAAANLAIHHINGHHHHGYKFKLGEIQGHKYEKVGEGCNIDLQLKLFETKCHFVNPKPAEDCELWEMGQRGASASCVSMLNVQDGVATVTRHQCTTQQVLTNEEMVRMCPDCPTMKSLDDPDMLKAVAEAVHKYNLESRHEHYFALLEVGRVLTSYIPSMGMVTYPKFALVETNCPRGARIALEACKPRCPNRAQYAICSTSYSAMEGVKLPECELYPAKDLTPLGSGEIEPMCESFHKSADWTTCRAQTANNDPALHQICPFPLLVQLPQQEEVHQ